jgi:multidrug resistance efflux pump
VNATAGSAALSASNASAARWKLANLEAGTREEVIAAAEAVRTQLVAQRDRVEAELALLVIRSPMDGVVATKHVGDRLGAWLARGDTFVEIHDVSAFYAEVHVPASAPLDELEIGDRVALRAEGLPGAKLESRIERLQSPQDRASGARSDLVVVTTPFVMPEGRSGLRGHARLYGRERSLGYAFLYLPLQRLVRVSLWVLL